MSTDLRDGNQALFEPMGGERKGNGPIAATVDALGLPLRVDRYDVN